jgi:hypothetical protein
VALARETGTEHRLNVAFSVVLVITLLALWIHFA